MNKDNGMNKSLKNHSINIRKSVNEQMFEPDRFLQGYFIFYKSAGETPDVKLFQSINREYLYQQILEQFDPGENAIIKFERYNNKTSAFEFDNCLIAISENIFVWFDLVNQVELLHSPGVEQDMLNQVIEVIKSCKEKGHQNHIYLLIQDMDMGLNLKPFELRKSEIDLVRNYNDDFAGFHEKITERLNKQNEKGILMLHGKPGTGKTTYIRYLASNIDKKMIFIPPDYAYKIASPDFLSLLMDHPNSILIIEDAENVIEQRQGSNNAAVSNLLNIADGLLSDCLSIQIICTFNTDISKIDNALLRKGRILGKYEFKPLKKEKARQLINYLQLAYKPDKEMTLAEIYNIYEEDYVPEQKNRIGF